MISSLSVCVVLLCVDQGVSFHIYLSPLPRMDPRPCSDLFLSCLCGAAMGGSGANQGISFYVYLSPLPWMDPRPSRGLLAVSSLFDCVVLLCVDPEPVRVCLCTLCRLRAVLLL